MEVDQGERVTVRISSRRPVRAKLVDEPPPGFAVDRADLDTALARDDAGVAVAASRYGQRLDLARLGQVVEQVADADGLTVAFGAPERGLPAITDREPDAVAEDGDDRQFDLWLNTIPNQGSEVVRTEEAMFATLAALTLE
jgi:predicted SPOUT superfamily RNA methylase MTH1